MEHGKIAKSKNQNQKQFVTVGEASSITGIEAQTIRKMADKASFICYRTPSQQRRINLQSLQEFISNSISNKKISQVSRKNILYARVSSKKQMGDLSGQVEYLKRARPEFFDYQLISDVASGINFKRKGLSTILDMCLHGTIGNIIVAHKDRLCRFGFELINELVQKSGGNIIVLNENNNKSNEQELSEDLLSIVQIFCCRQMGKRKYKRAKIQDTKSEIVFDAISETKD
jgi:putative resolvase